MKSKRIKTIVDTKNGADGTTYEPIEPAGPCALQLDLDGGSGGASGVTVTVEATAQEGATSPVYIDITDDLFGSASFTADAILFDDLGILAMFDAVRIKIVASTGAADDADWRIDLAEIYDWPAP